MVIAQVHSSVFLSRWRKKSLEHTRPRAVGVPSCGGKVGISTRFCGYLESARVYDGARGYGSHHGIQGSGLVLTAPVPPFGWDG